MAVNAKPAKMNGTANKPNGSAGHHNPMPHPSTPNQSPPPEPLEWDWDIEHADRARERQADAALHGATPFEVDRRVLKDVVLEHMKTPVARIVFMSAGTFHKVRLFTPLFLPFHPTSPPPSISACLALSTNTDSIRRPT
jgi:hypothetical protein